MMYRKTEAYQVGREARTGDKRVSIQDVTYALEQFPACYNEILMSAIYDIVDIAKLDVAMRQNIEQLFMIHDLATRHGAKNAIKMATATAGIRDNQKQPLLLSA